MARMKKGDRVRFTGDSAWALGTVSRREGSRVHVDLDFGAEIETEEDFLVRIDPETPILENPDTKTG